MGFSIDLATLNNVSAAFYAILLMLLFVFQQQNRDIDAIIWWCGFPLFRLVNALISSDSTEYASEIFIYVGNVSIILSDTFLLIGCLKFTEKRVNWLALGAYNLLFVAACVYLYLEQAGLAERTQSVIVFDLIPLVATIYALSALSNKGYVVEKFFIIFWTTFQIGIFTFWILINFDFGNPTYGSIAVISLSFVYLSHIFTTVGLIILTIARQRDMLQSEINSHAKLERDLEQILADAQASNREKDLFLANMSHELRTPLNAIIGFSESLKMGLYGSLNEKQKEYIDNIYGGGELLLKLITDLLNLSNIEEGKVEISLEEVNLNVLFEKTLPLLKEITGMANDRLIVDNKLKETGKPAAVYIDQIRTKQILINFVSNAVKYSQAKTPVQITLVSHDDDFFRVSVADQGMGIAEDQYKNIFKPFNRAANTGSKVDGVGVGLSIAKTLIEEMQGRIGFESEPGVGSTFWIDVPKSKQRQLEIE